MSKKRPKIGYLCSYLPSGVLESLELELVPIYKQNRDCSKALGDLPINICGYVRYAQKLIREVEFDGIIVTNCCNAMQRLYDSIRLSSPEKFCHLLELPRSEEKQEQHFFKKSLFHLLTALAERFSLEIDTVELVESLIQNGEGEAEQLETIEQKETIYLFGSAVSPQMRERIEEYLAPFPVSSNLCADRGESFRGGFLQAAPCARMTGFFSWFKRFLAVNHSSLAGLIFIASQHCDSYLFNYPLLEEECKSYDLPILFMEEGYRLTGFGQILTRLEAFTESINFKKMVAMKGEKGTKEKSSTTTSRSEKVSPIFKQMMRLVEGILPKLPLESIKMVVKNQSEIFAEKVWKNPEKIVWTNMVMPQEIFYAADLIPVNMELIAGWLASLGLSRRYISQAEAIGFSSNLCSYHKTTIGLLEEGGFPAAKGAAISSHICDGSVGVVNYFAEKYGTDVFTMNVPFFSGQVSEEYLLSQYGRLIDWVESYTEKKISAERLREAMDYSNQARRYWIKAFEIRKGEPLFPGHLSLRNLFGATFLFGSKLGLEVAKAYYEQLLTFKETANSSRESQKRSKEKKRLLWIHFAPLYNNQIMEFLENELDCWIVMDITGHIHWPRYDLERPLESLVKRTLSHFYLGDPVKRGELYHKLAVEYDVDGIIHFMHNGCRAIPGSSTQVREIANNLELPYLELAGDCIDPHSFSKEQIRLRLEAFNETLRRDF